MDRMIRLIVPSNPQQHKQYHHQTTLIIQLMIRQKQYPFNQDSQYLKIPTDWPHPENIQFCFRKEKVQRHHSYCNRRYQQMNETDSWVDDLQSGQSTVGNSGTALLILQCQLNLINFIMLSQCYRYIVKFTLIPKGCIKDPALFTGIIHERLEINQLESVDWCPEQERDSVQYQTIYRQIHNMKTNHKNHKIKEKTKKAELSVEDQLAVILKSINKFLKRYFDLVNNSLPEYKEKVREFFVEHSTTLEYSCAFSSLFSKLGNMLQPFLHLGPPNYPHNLINNYQQIDPQPEVYALRQQIGSLEYKNTKLTNKIKNLKEELSNYRKVNIRLTNFMYMLRINNIDVDTLYEKGCVEMERESKQRQEINRQGTKLFQRSKERIQDNYVTN